MKRCGTRNTLKIWKLKNYRGEEIPPLLPVEDYNEKGIKLLTQINNNEINTIEGLIMLYNMLDSVCSYLKNYFSCIKGCTYCCHFLIGISRLEAELIKNNLQFSKLRTGCRC